ncbi:MAG: HAMP domain-containing protein [Tepidiformaceae bacterium]
MKVLRMVTLHDASIRAKLGVLVALMSIPIIVLLVIQYQARHADVTLAQRESHGLTYVNAIVPVIQEVQNHRNLTTAVANGNAAAKPALAASTQAVERDLAALNAVDGKYGKAFGTSTLIAFVNDEWTRVKADTAGSIDTVSFGSHSQLIDDGLLPLVTQAGEASQLFLDSNASGIRSIGPLTETTLEYAEALSTLQGYAIGVATSRQGQPVTDFESTFMQNQQSQATSSSDTLTRRLQTAMTNNPALEARMRPLLLGTQAASLSFFASLGGGIINATAINVSGDAISAEGQVGVDSALKVYTSATAPLVPEFQDRISSARYDLFLEIGIALAGVVIALLLSGIVARSVTGPMAHLADVADRMSLGELDVDIDITSKNEIGQLAESLRRMQASLRSAIERLRVRRAAA